VAGNHDEPRIASRLGAAQARQMMVLLLTLRGTPTIYYGDELGFVDAVVPPERRQDPWGLQVTEVDVGRDPARAPMLWSVGKNGGFTDPGIEPWLPIIDPAQYSVDAQLGSQGTMLELTRSLLRLRRERVSLRLGSYTGLTGLPPNCYGFMRDHGSERMVIVASFADETVDVTLPLPGAWRLVATTSAVSAETPMIVSGSMRLDPREAVVLEPDG
jgi:alpha-glucosidase